MTNLERMLRSFDLPDYRKSKETPQNLRWLLRNIRIKNSNNQKLDEAEALIREMTNG